MAARWLFLLLASLVPRAGLAAPPAPAQVVFIADAWALEADLPKKVVETTRDLLGERYSVRVTPVATPAAALETLRAAWAERGVKVVVGLGLLGNGAIGQALEGKPPPRPTLAAGLIDPALQGIPVNAEGTSPIDGFGFVLGTTDLARDFELLKAIRPYRHLAVLAPPGVEAIFPPIKTLLRRNLPGEDVAMTVVSVGADASLEGLPADADAAYVLPLLHLKPPARKALYDALSAKGLPAVALLGRPEVELGAYGSVAPIAQLDTFARRVALDVSRTLDGRDPRTFPVRVSAYSPDLVFNMRVVGRSQVYPPFELANTATFVEVDEVAGEEKLGLQALVAEGLKANFDLHRVRLDVPIAVEAARSARGDLLPEITASTNVAATDQESVNQAFGSRNQTTWSGALELQQVIFADGVWANLTVQKLLTEANRLGVKGAELQVVRDVALAYLRVLQAKNLVRLQNENVSVSKQNQDLAIAGQAAGGTNAADVHRWESQLALGKMDLLDAAATLDQARQNLNRLLGRPIAAPIDVVALSLEQVMATMLDSRLGEHMRDGGAVKRFAAFLALDAVQTTPVLKQLDKNVAAQARVATTRNRQIWLPTFAASASLTKPFKGWGEAEGMAIAEPRTSSSWNVGVVATLPIFDGFSNYAEHDKAKLELEQLRRQRALTQQSVETQIHAGMAVLGRRFARIGLARTAARASRENLRLVQAGYAVGQAPIAQVIDAQAALLQAETLAANAVYDFVASYLDIELARGWFSFLASPAERDAFLARFEAYLKGERK